MTKTEYFKMMSKLIMDKINGMLITTLNSLPIAIILGGLVYLIIRYLRRNRKINIDKLKTVCIVLLTMYLSALLQISIFFRQFGYINSIDLVPFNTPGGTEYIVLYALANALVFIPLGILLPIICKPMKSIKYCVLSGMGLSLIIEISQLILKCGVVQTEDLIMNTVGVIAGYYIYRKVHLWKNN